MGVYFIQENEYPKLLKEIGKDIPKQLYYKGSWDTEIFENCLAVVGSRQMTTYGRQVTDRIVGEAAVAGLTIVSGFMYGIDAQAHKAALKVAGRTIAVMPCGIERIHPEYQQDLYVEILNNKGLVISEYEGDAMPINWMYPRRNRIVAGLSKAALIIEAGERSGSLITASFAQKFGRKIFVVPGPITSENSRGIMQLIREGAEAIASGEEIVKFYKNDQCCKNYKDENKNIKSTWNLPCLNSLEENILKRLKKEALSVDDLAGAYHTPVAKINVTLSLMELRGLIRQEGGKYYIC